MKKENILVIEDEVDTQELIKAFFRPRGFELMFYEDAKTALDDIRTDKVSPDVIVTDLMLPNISGLEFIKELKKTRDLARLPILLITANGDVRTAVEAMQAGAFDFVLKPLHFPQLLLTLQRALYLRHLEQERFLSSGIHEDIHEVTHLDGVIGESPGFKKVLDITRRVASSSANVLITGESGTGKEVIAKAIHQLGPRANGPFVAINCSAIPENLLESELFGHAKGAFTGAVNKKAGLLEEAEGGTLFLDEIGDLNPLLQAKLLRVLQDRKVKRVGENDYRTLDIRVVSATNRNLRRDVDEKKFREDLFFRLNVIPIGILPLRERREDISPLAEFFLKKYVVSNQRRIKGFSEEAIAYLQAQAWPGNVRELENTIERAVVLARTDKILVEDLKMISEEVEAPEEGRGLEFVFKSSLFSSQKVLSMDELTKSYIQYALELNQGAKDKTAKDLGIDRKTLYRKLNIMENEKRGAT